jgi:hypothetical protein
MSNHKSSFSIVPPVLSFPCQYDRYFGLFTAANAIAVAGFHLEQQPTLIKLGTLQTVPENAAQHNILLRQNLKAPSSAEPNDCQQGNTTR